MSVSIDSWERAIGVAATYYHRYLPTVYDPEYLVILQNIVGQILGTTRYAYVETNVPLLEPIVRYRDIVYFSRPLIAQCVNRAPLQPSNAIAYESGPFDLFERVNDVTPPERDVECRRVIDLRKTAENARFCILVRLVLMARHWRVHDVRRIPYDSHRDFVDLEMARRCDVADDDY